MAWGTYMLRSSLVSVFIRLRVKARTQSCGPHGLEYKGLNGYSPAIEGFMGAL